MIYKGSCKTEDWINDAKNIYKYIYTRSNKNARSRCAESGKCNYGLHSLTNII